MAAVMVMLVVATVLFAVSRSDEPDLLGGGYFIADTSGGGSGRDGPPSFNLVDGTPEVRVAEIGRYLGVGASLEDLVPLNSSAGLFVLDTRTGDLAGFNRALVDRPLVPYRMASRARGGSALDPVVGHVAGETVFVVDPAGAGGSVEVRHFSDAGFTLHQAANDAAAKLASAAGGGAATQAFSPTAVAVDGDYLGSAVSDESLWVLVGDGDELRLVSFAGSAPGASLTSVDSDDDSEPDSRGPADASVELTGEWAIPRAEVEPGTGAEATGTVTAVGDAGVAVARVVNGVVEVRFFTANGPGQTVAFAGVQNVDRLYPVTGGAAALFIAHTADSLGVAGSDGFVALGAEPSGRVSTRNLDMLRRSGPRELAAAAIGQMLVVGDPTEGLVHAIDLDFDASVKPPLDYPAGAAIDLSGLVIERAGDRFVVNGPRAPQALLLDRDGVVLSVLVKSDATVVDPATIGSGEDTDDTTSTTLPEQTEPTVPKVFVDPNLEPCGPRDEDLGEVSNPSTEPSSREVTITWRYTPGFVDTASCAPLFFLELASAADGPLIGGRRQVSSGTSARIGDLRPDTPYAVRVVAEIEGTDKSVASGWVSFRTSTIVPNAPSRVFATALGGGEGWRVRWDPCEESCDGSTRSEWLVSSEQDRRETRIVDADDFEVRWPVDVVNTGVELTFQVRASGDSGVSTATSTTEEVASYTNPRAPNPAMGEVVPDTSDEEIEGKSERLMTVSYDVPTDIDTLAKIFGVRASDQVTVTARRTGTEDYQPLSEPFEVDPEESVDFEVLFKTDGGEDVYPLLDQVAGLNTCMVDGARFIPPPGQGTYTIDGPDDPPWEIVVGVEAKPSGCANAGTLVGDGGGPSDPDCGRLVGALINEIKVTCGEARWAVEPAPEPGYQVEIVDPSKLSWSSPNPAVDFPIFPEFGLTVPTKASVTISLNEAGQWIGTVEPDGVFSGVFTPNSDLSGSGTYDVAFEVPTSRAQGGFGRGLDRTFDGCDLVAPPADVLATVPAAEGLLCQFTIPPPPPPAASPSVAVSGDSLGLASGIWSVGIEYAVIFGALVAPARRRRPDR